MADSARASVNATSATKSLSPVEPTTDVARASDIEQARHRDATGLGAPPRQARLLADPSLIARFSSPQRVLLIQRFQHDYGNAQVSRLLAQVHATSTAAIVQLQGNADTAPPAAGQTTIKPVKNATYTVTAKTLKEAADQIGARTEAGETTWKPTYSVTPDENGNVTKATVTVEITVTMPSWPGAAKLGAADKAKWDSFYAALRAHEQGHVDLAKSKLANVADSLIGKSQTDAGTAFQQALTDLQTASDDYDTRTDHGIKTGCKIDTGDDDTTQSTDSGAGVEE